MRLLPFCMFLCLSGIAVSTRAVSREDLRYKHERGPKYDPATVVHISGVIQDVRELANPPALKGMHVILRVEKRTVRVYVAPAAFLEAFEFRVVKGDDLQVSGSQVKFEGSDLILARQFRKNTDVLVLRDEDGRPYWEDEVFKMLLPLSRAAPGRELL